MIPARIPKHDIKATNVKKHPRDTDLSGKGFSICSPELFKGETSVGGVFILVNYTQEIN